MPDQTESVMRLRAGHTVAMLRPMDIFWDANAPEEDVVHGIEHWTAPRAGTWRLTLGRTGPVTADWLGDYESGDTLLPTTDVRGVQQRIAELRGRLREAEGRRNAVVPVPKRLLEEQPVDFRTEYLNSNHHVRWDDVRTNYVVPRELAQTARQVVSSYSVSSARIGPPDGPDGPPPLKLKPPLCACGNPTDKKWEHTQDACDFLDS